MSRQAGPSAAADLGFGIWEQVGTTGVQGGGRGRGRRRDEPDHANDDASEGGHGADDEGAA